MTSFEEKVYLEVKKIPKGKVDTYKGIAVKIGYPNAARAVGNALHIMKALLKSNIIIA